MAKRGKRRRRSLGRRLQRGIERVGMGVQNGLDIIRLGQLGQPYGAPFEVRHEDPVYRLRHYTPPEGLPGEGEKSPVLLVPPLMVASEIYDISPELSAVTALVQKGVDVWLVDFGSPEEIEGAMDRTLDDHLRAVDEAIDRVREATGRDVHLAGYSQGGMFAYQVAAYRRSEGLSSIITFGSPVDIHQNLPGIADEMAGRIIDVVRKLAERPLESIDGLPGFLTSTGFKVLSIRKEAAQLVDFWTKLHDRQALERRERSRRFLAGAGFVAWPGPAFRKFVDEVIVHNRMASGGFVIMGRTVTLADITIPVLYFVGTRDDIARPPSVRSIRDAAPNAELFEVPLKAGHFGLVVGSRSLSHTWPCVAEWTRYRDADGPLPTLLVEEEDHALEDAVEADFDDVDFDIELFVDVIQKGLKAVTARFEEISEDAGQAVDNLRWQLPRLSRLRGIDSRSTMSPGLALAEQAAALPNQTFFLWKGRAFTYAETDRRVNAVVKGLLHCGIGEGQKVGVYMGRRPSYLTMTTALSRVRAVSVLLGSGRVNLARAIDIADIDALVVDPERADEAREVFEGPVLVLGGGGDDRDLRSDVIDMEAIAVDQLELPEAFRPDAGAAQELMGIIFTASKDEEPRAVRITNRRWAVSALGAAATCMLTPKDTVYCCLPLHHAAGNLVAVGGALVGGARLALATNFSAELFWPEVRRYGATVVFYANDMCRELTNADVAPGEDNNPVRLFAGSGMRVDVWQKILERFGGAGVLEFYATTEGNAVLANASGEKVGAVGRPLPGSNDISVLRYDFAARELVRAADGFCERCGPDEPGILVARVDSAHPMAGFDGFTEEGETARRLRRNVFELDDTWFVSGDYVRIDRDGDAWFIDRVSDLMVTDTGAESTRAVEDRLHDVPAIGQAVVYPVDDGGERVAVATVVLLEDVDFDVAEVAEAVAELHRVVRPRYLVVADELELTDGYRARKSPLRALGVPGPDAGAVYRLVGGEYVADERAASAHP